jgi:hypothetical protein
MTIIKHISILLPLALVACGVKVNGKSYGLGGSSNSSSGSSGSSGSSSSGNSASESSDEAPRYAAPSSQCYMMTRDGDHPPILSSPADPWLAVSSDKPVDLEHRSLTMWQAGDDCSAQHDHCLRDCIWFTDDTRRGDEPGQSNLAIYGQGQVSVVLSGAPMYRTVPATKRMLTRGAIVVALREMQATPASDYDWQIGTLDRVDWKAETMYMVGSNNPYRLSSTRVAVLSWREGGKVEIVGGRKRNELAVRTDELFLPKTIIAQSDPWSQVKDGNPIVVADTQPFAEVDGMCKPENDHCLRPWAWLVDNNSGFAFVGKYDGKTFQALRAIDEPKRIDGIVAAYRTVPATRANLKVGVQVFLVNGSEQSQHTTRWDIGKVIKVRGDDQVDVAMSSRDVTLPMNILRVPVLVWFPGEKVEKL